MNACDSVYMFQRFFSTLFSFRIRNIYYFYCTFYENSTHIPPLPTFFYFLFFIIIIINLFTRSLYIYWKLFVLLSLASRRWRRERKRDRQIILSTRDVCSVRDVQRSAALRNISVNNNNKNNNNMTYVHCAMYKYNNIYLHCQTQ